MTLLIHVKGSKIQLAEVEDDIDYVLVKKGDEYKIIEFEQVIRPEDVITLKAEVSWLRRLLDAHKTIKSEIK
jgi:hypothetical protein